MAVLASRLNRWLVAGAPLLEWVAALLALGAAALVAFGVIPTVRDVWVPSTTGSGGSVPVFWASVIANVTFAGVLAMTASRWGLGSRRKTWAIAVLGAGAMVQALMYLDAAAAFHGPLEDEMRATRTRVQLAATADAMAGALVLLAALGALFSRRVSRPGRT